MKTVKLEDFNESKKPWETEGVEWREVRFTDIIEIFDKYRVPVKKSDRKPGPYPYCGANGIIDFVDGYTHNGEFILLAEDGGFFKKGEQTAYIISGKFWANNHVHVLKPKPNIAINFLYYFSILYDFTLHLRGATRPKLSQIGIKKIKIPIPFHNGKPDLETQKKIVEYIEANFEKIDKILEKKKKELKLLDELWESVLEHAFKPKDGEEWREMRLGEVVKIIRGVNFKKSDLSSVNSDKAIITASNITEEKIKAENLIFVSTDRIKNEQRIRKEDIIIVMSTGSRTALGRTYYSKLDEEFYIGAFLGILRINHPIIISNFIYLFTKTQAFRSHLINYTGSQINNISIKKLKNLKIPIPFHNNQPDLKKQKEITQYLDKVYHKTKILKEKINNQITQLEELKESILDEAFRHNETK